MNAKQHIYTKETTTIMTNLLKSKKPTAAILEIDWKKKILLYFHAILLIFSNCNWLLFFTLVIAKKFCKIISLIYTDIWKLFWIFQNLTTLKTSKQAYEKRTLWQMIHSKSKLRTSTKLKEKTTANFNW